MVSAIKSIVLVVWGMQMDDIRESLKAVQWQRCVRELRAFSALAGSYPNDRGMGEKWIKINAKIEVFIATFENAGFHE